MRINLTDPDRQVLLIGGGGHAKVVIETILKYHRELTIAGIIEKDRSLLGRQVLGIPVVGVDEELNEFYNAGFRKAFITLGSVGNSCLRMNMYNLATRIGFDMINVISGTSQISDYVKMGKGNAIMGGAIINACVEIGNNCIINTGSIVEHDCIIRDNVHIAPGAKLAGGVTVMSHCMIGMGATVIQGVKIGENSIVGAGSVVLRDVPPNCVVAGVPAKIIKENRVII